MAIDQVDFGPYRITQQRSLGEITQGDGGAIVLTVISTVTVTRRDSEALFPASFEASLEGHEAGILELEDDGSRAPNAIAIDLGGKVAMVFPSCDDDEDLDDDERDWSSASGEGEEPSL